MMHPNREVKGISVEYVLWAFAAFGLFSFAAIMAGAIRFNRARRWEDRLDVLQLGLDSMASIAASGPVFSEADKEAALSMIIGRTHPDVPDTRAFEMAINSLSMRGMRELDEIGRLAQTESRQFQASDATSRALVLTAVCLAIEGERLRRAARDEMGAVIANGSMAKALMAIWPQPDFPEERV